MDTEREPIKKIEFRGRRSKLTRKIIKSISTKVRKGSNFRAAALSSGVGESTFYSWLARGREETSGLYREFLESLEASSAQVEVEISESLLDISTIKSDGRVALEFLRRRNPTDWNIPDRTEVSTSGQMEFVVDLGQGRADE